MPDRFSEDEARRIFARAAERQHTASPDPTGLSLAELKEIAGAAGIAPEHVAAAADLRGAPPADEPARFLGVDMEPRASRVLPGRLSDDAWAQVVGRLRREFGAQGTASQIGRVREWSSGPGSRLHVTAEPVGDDTRVTLESSKTHEVAHVRPVGITMGVAGVLLTALLLAIGDGPPAAAVAVGALLPAVWLAVYGISWRIFAAWSRKRQVQFDALLDPVELIARAAAPAADLAPDTTRQRLDLDGLAEAPGERPAPRRRARSGSR